MHHAPTILIASYIEPEYISRIQQISPTLNIHYQPSLLPVPRYPADHTNQCIRTLAQETEWRNLLRTADILFDFDHTHLEDLPLLAPQVRWIQATSAGIGQLVRRLGYHERMPDTIFTTASGVHAQPLAEFCLMAMLMWSRNYWQMQRDQQLRRWERFGATDLAGRTLGIIGVGNVGREVARMARALGMRVIGSKRTISGIDPASLHLHALYHPHNLAELLRQSEYLVLITPHTDETDQLIGASELALLPPGALLINIGRGALIDEAALIAALQSGHLGGAALDVFAHEPLAADSPLWAMPQVLISPHSASTSNRENARLTDLFCDNLQRFLAGMPLRNVLDIHKLY
jgi:glyoxylate/hydroxypyruvate reductase